MLNLSIHLEGKYATQLIPAITFVPAVQFWSSLHRLASCIPLSAWTPHMPHITCPYVICQAYAICQNMAYLAIMGHIWAYVICHRACNMWHVGCPDTQWDATSQTVKTRPKLHCQNKSYGRYKLRGIFPLQMYA